ncbi:leukocyte surface antigen CD53-like [Bolinopsis microptera]|uniref:leukocyte surface antigen CD53-like n=1 Tax=Bolinopsis microptera TaxID=2820187 RepID=UPI0030790F31
MGLVVTVVGFTGYIGATNESTSLLMAFFVSVLMLVLLQTGLAITIFVFQEELEEQITYSARDKFRLYGNPNASRIATDPIDFVQKELRCCGLSNGPFDWSDESDRFANYWIRTRSEDVPDSCCAGLKVSSNCGKGMAVRDPKKGAVYTKGCQTVLIDFFRGNFNVMGALTIVLVGVQLAGLCLYIVITDH